MEILYSCLKKGIGQLFLKEGIKGFDQRKREKGSWLGIQERSTFLHMDYHIWVLAWEKRYSLHLPYMGIGRWKQQIDRFESCQLEELNDLLFVGWT